MRRTILLTLSLTLITAGSPLAGTFDRTRIAPELGLDKLTREVAHERLGRDLFANPYSTVTIGSVDVYPVFPYVEARTFQIVSDPRWNRLVYGEAGRSLKAFSGASGSLGALSDPRGMAVDENNHVYVADAGNDRVVVLKASTEFGEIELIPLYDIKGLSRPFGVAYSDGGTPFKAGDDYLYVADTGKNRVVAFALGEAGARQTATLGELGSGSGRFAGPMAIAVGRSGGTHTRDVYVADAHTRRIVHLKHEGGGLQWISDAQHDADVVTSLETDQWGNLYAAAPNQSVVRKFNASLSPVAELHSDLARPRSFHVPFFNVRDHRAGSVERVGRPNGLSVEQWTDATGVRLWNLGVEVSDLAIVGSDAPAAHFTLTDQARVTLDITDASTGRARASRSAGSLAAGVYTLPLLEEDLRAAAGAGDPVVRVSAVSSYPDGPSAVARARLSSKGAAVLPDQATMLSNTPNPVQYSTRLTFVLPAGSQGAKLRAFDAGGRLVRTFERRFTAGLNEVIWDGTNDRGADVPAGVYFYRLEVGGKRLIRKMVLVR